MSNTITRVSHQSYGSRITNSCKGMLMAPILLIIGISLLVWNEGNSVTQHKALDEGLQLVQEVTTDSVDPNDEGNLIHFIGKATTDSQVEDTVFGVAPDGVLKLKRKVEMYQWVEKKHQETKKNTGGSTDTITTYTYSKEWSTQVVYSNGFEESDGHENPGEMLYSSQTFEASTISVGAFELSSAVTNYIMWFQPLDERLSTDTIAENNDESQIHVQVSGNSFYFGDNPGSPSIGDLRVSFEVVPEQTISVVGRQTAGSLSTYTASAGGSVLLVESGPHDAPEMFKHANQALNAQTWIFRFVGFIFIFIAFQSLMAPLSVVADVIPFIGDLVEVGNSCLSFFLGAVVSVIVIAISWLAYRPLFSIILFGIVGAAIYGMKKYRAGANKGVVVEANAYELPAAQFKDTTDHFEDV